MLGSMQTVSPAARRGGWLVAASTAAVVLVALRPVNFAPWPYAVAEDLAGSAASAPSTNGAADREFLPAPSSAEQAILDALAQPTACEFQETPLREVVDFLNDKHNIEMQLDEKALEEAGVGGDTPVTAALKKVSLRSALQLLLAPLELAWVIQDEVVQITTQDQADCLLLTRTYPVADLGPDFDNLVDAITATVAPQSWSAGGGPASIVVVPASQCIVVSQTRPAHDAILMLLRSLRSARASQGGPSPGAEKTPDGGGKSQ